MDEILYLEPDEEITSVIDKMHELKAKSVGLVVPRGATILQSIVNLKLIQKEARALNQDLAIITADKIGQNLSAQLGITTFDNLDQPRPIIQTRSPEPPKNEEMIEINMSSQAHSRANLRGVKVYQYQRQEIDKDREMARIASTGIKNKTNGKWKIIAPIIIIAAVLVAFYLFYPKVEVKLTIETEPYNKEMEIAVSASPSPSLKDLNREIIKGEIIEKDQTIEKELAASTEKNIGEIAKGELTIFNSWDSNEQSFPEGTNFTSIEGKEFISVETVTVSGASAAISEGQLITNAGKVKVKVKAANAGDEYNIGPSKFTIGSLPKNKQGKIYAESGLPMTGGSSKKIKIIGEGEVGLAKEVLIKEASQNLANELKSETKGKRIIEGSISQEIKEITVSPETGKEADKFKIKLVIKNKTLVFQEKDYREKVIEIIKKDLPQEKQLILSEEDEIATSLINLNLEQSEMVLRANVKTKIASKRDEKMFKTQIIGKSKNEAEDILEKNNGVKQAEVILKPAWWLRKVPSLERNIKFGFDYQ